jgi:hypothetical protein
MVIGIIWIILRYIILGDDRVCHKIKKEAAVLTNPEIFMAMKST